MILCRTKKSQHLTRTCCVRGRPKRAGPGYDLLHHCIHAKQIVVEIVGGIGDIHVEYVEIR